GFPWRVGSLLGSPLGWLQPRSAPRPPTARSKLSSYAQVTAFWPVLRPWSLFSASRPPSPALPPSPSLSPSSVSLRLPSSPSSPSPCPPTPSWPAPFSWSPLFPPPPCPFLETRGPSRPRPSPRGSNRATLL